jgi:hypothetical protein
LSRLTRFHITIHGILEIHLVPPQRKALAIRSSARLHEQNDRNPNVRGCCAEDSLFFIHGQHTLRRPLPAFLEMFHAGRRFSAMYLRFTANSNMHCRYSSARLTVAPFTVFLDSAASGLQTHENRVWSLIALCLSLPIFNFTIGSGSSAPKEKFETSVFFVSQVGGVSLRCRDAP